MMADSSSRHFALSQQAKKVLDMVTDKSDITLSKQRNSHTVSILEKPESTSTKLTDLYATPYSLTTPLFDTFYETEVTSVDSFDADNSTNTNKHFPINHTNNELSTNKHNTDMICNENFDFNLDDSVKDKDYLVIDCNSDSEDNYKEQIKRQESVPQYICQMRRKRECNMETSTSQSLRKRRKYDTTLQQRKLTAKNKKKMEHRVKEGCNASCMKKCSSLLSNEEREAVNEAYWNMSWQERHLFIDAHTSEAIPKKKITSEPKRKPKRIFILKKYNETSVEVCKIFFLTTLGYKKSNDRILHTTFVDPTMDKRGKHQKTPAFDRDLLTQHVESFNLAEPHHRPELASHPQYILPSDVNIVSMHKDFCEMYPDKKVSYELYRQHVKKMNISFARLGNEKYRM